MKEKLSPETKALFNELRARRAALGIVYEKWSMLCDTAAHQSLTEYWASFRQMLGRERATDYMIYLMDFGYHMLVAAKEKGKKDGRKDDRRRTRSR